MATATTDDLHAAGLVVTGLHDLLAAHVWHARLIRAGLHYHADDDPHTVGNAPYGIWEPTFTPEAADIIWPLMQQAADLIGDHVYTDCVLPHTFAVTPDGIEDVDFTSDGLDCHTSTDSTEDLQS